MRRESREATRCAWQPAATRHRAAVWHGRRPGSCAAMRRGRSDDLLRWGLAPAWSPAAPRPSPSWSVTTPQKCPTSPAGRRRAAPQPARRRVPRSCLKAPLPRRTLWRWAQALCRAGFPRGPAASRSAPPPPASSRVVPRAIPSSPSRPPATAASGRMWRVAREALAGPAPKQVGQRTRNDMRGPSVQSSGVPAALARPPRG